MTNYLRPTVLLATIVFLVAGTPHPAISTWQLTPVTDNTLNDEYPNVSATSVVWRQTVSPSPSDQAAMVFDGITISQIASDLSNAQSIEWTTECADCPPLFVQMRPDSFQFDNAGTPILACGFDHLYTISQVGTDWQIETVDPEPAVGMFASMAVDSSNALHISYFDDRNDHLKYARQTGSVWTITTLDNLPGCGYFTSIELDASGYPHIAYGDNRSGSAGLYYTFFNGTSWQYETIQTEHVAFYTSLALNADGEPRIAWQDQYERKLKYSVRSTSGWTTETVTQQSQCGEGCVLILDEVDYPHILFMCDTLQHSWNSGSGWQFETVSNLWAGNISARFDESDVLHAAWIDSVGLRYATWNSSIWTIETAQADSENEEFTGSSLTLDSAGLPAIMYCENRSNQIRFCRREGENWVSEPVISGANVGGSSSAVSDGSDNVFVSYTDRNNHRLKFAFQDSGTWEISEPDQQSLAFYTSMVIDSGLHSHILYYDAASQSLKYATNQSGSWSISTLETDAGAFCRLVIDASDTLHAVYYKATTILSYAVNSGSGWEYDTIFDQTGYSGNYIGLTLDTFGYPHVSFFNPVLSTLGYAYRDASGWQIENAVDPEPQTGYYSSIALDANGYPRISYCDSLYDDNLRYAEWNGSAWTIQILDGSLGLDRKLHITESRSKWLFSSGLPKQH